MFWGFIPVWPYQLLYFLDLVSAHYRMSLAPYALRHFLS